MEIRRAEPSDAEAFVEVLNTVAQEGRWIATEVPFDVPARSAKVRAAIEDGEPHWLVVDDAGTAVGCMGMHATAAEGVGTFGMALVPGARGSGTGRRLLETLIAHARESGLHKLELDVWLHNGRAIALYASAGFEVEGIRRDHWRRRDGSLQSSLLMGMLLP